MIWDRGQIFGRFGQREGGFSKESSPFRIVARLFARRCRGVVEAVERLAGVGGSEPALRGLVR